MSTPMNGFPDSQCHEETVPAGECPSLASLLALLESVPALLWETDAHLRLTCLTGAALHVMGIPSGRYAGEEVASLFPAGNGARRAHERALAGEAGSFEVDLNGRDMRASVKPLRGPGGEIEGVLGIALDMTERMVAERALRLSEHSCRSLIEDAPYGICRSTIGGELLQVNRAMGEMLGYDAASSELLLRDLPLIFSSPTTFEAFQRAVLATGSHPATEGTWIRRDGHPIQVRLSGRLVCGPSGEMSHLDIFAEDVTEKKRLEAELSQAQRMQAIGQLAGGVAHDFNNLLTVIAGHVELMLGQPASAKFRERLEEVKRASEKAASLTRQLLAFSRRQVLRSRIVNLNEVIGQLMGMLSRLIKENIKLVFEPGEELGSVKADPNEIERVLLNLAVNAQDAMPAGGRLTIATANVRVAEPLQSLELSAGDYVRIEVRDTGIGMDR
jgi:two-component system, cell cycle sensor histidine kinase and response regulator CckA